MIGQVPEAEFAQAQRLVEIMAARWYAQNAPRCPPGWDGDDARAAALHGLVTAAQRFDPAKGFRFNTYASSMALGYVRKQLRDYAPVAKDLKRTGEWGSGAFPLEFDRPTGDEDSVSFGELLADDAPGPEALLLADFPAGLEVDQEALWQAVDALKPPQGQVIRWRFQEGKTLQEIAERLKCSRQGVWGLLERALRKLKHCLKADQKTRKAGGRNKTMTMTMERTNSTSNGTLPAWTKRAGAMFARWREADRFTRSQMERNLAPAEAAALDQFERNLTAVGEPKTWFVNLDNCGSPLKPAEAIVRRLLHGLQVQEAAIPDLLRACRLEGRGPLGGALALEEAIRKSVGRVVVAAPRNCSEIPKSSPEPAPAGGVPKPTADAADVPARAPEIGTLEPEPVAAKLSKREQIERWVAEGEFDLAVSVPWQTQKEWAAKLGMAASSVSAHLSNIRRNRGIEPLPSKPAQSLKPAPPTLPKAVAAEQVVTRPPEPPNDTLDRARKAESALYETQQQLAETRALLLRAQESAQRAERDQAQRLAALEAQLAETPAPEPAPVRLPAALPEITDDLRDEAAQLLFVGGDFSTGWREMRWAQKAMVLQLAADMASLAAGR